MGNKFVFFISFSIGYCAHLPESSAPSAGWTPSAADTEYRLSGIAAKLNLRKVEKKEERLSPPI